MTGRIDGKVAIITGGASGMGRASVLRFLEEGAHVAFADLNQEMADETLRLAKQRGFEEDRVAFTLTDVAKEADIEKMVSFALTHFGRLDCLFSNAGIGGAIGPITETSVEDWDETFAILTRSVFLGIKHGGQAMQRQGSGGSIISTASIAGFSGGAGPQAYSAAKAAVVNLTQNAALELAADRIRVNAIAPGVIVTPLANRERDITENAATMQPWPEAGKGEDIASLALFLASDDASFISGQTIVCDGGLLARGPRLFRHDETRTLVNEATLVGMTYGTTGAKPRIRKIDGD